MKIDITELKAKIEEANKCYRLGDPIMSDIEYDNLIDELKALSPNDELLKDTGSLLAIDNERMVDLPIAMHSFEKVYEQDLLTFLNKYSQFNMVASTKYDGAALLIEYRDGYLYEGYTKGRENVGQKAKDHAIALRCPLTIPLTGKTFVKVEVLMKKSMFDRKYRRSDTNPTGYKNSRNMCAGLLNSKTISPVLYDCEIKAHTLISEEVPYASKDETFMLLKTIGYPVADYIDAFDFPKDLKEWEEKLLDIKNGDYMADGLVIEICAYNKRKELGMNHAGNPNFGIAYKVQYEENTALTTVTNVEWNISKLGALVPRIEYVPVELNETTCTYAAGFNYKFVVDNKLGIGSKIKLQKSGDIIPYITDVINETASKMNIPTTCPHCDSTLKVSDTGVQLQCINIECPATKFYRTVAFFKTLDVENFGESLIEKVVTKHNINNFQELMNLKKSDFVMDGIGEKSANKIYNDIRLKFEKSLSQPHILMHATGCFGGTLGSRKLKVLVETFGESILTHNIGIHEITIISGFEATTAKAFINGLVKFKEWVNKNNIKLIFEQPTSAVTDGKFSGQSFVLTGFRDAELQSKIEAQGGKISSGVSKTTTAVITNDVNSSSSKITKAKSLGINVISREDFKI